MQTLDPGHYYGLATLDGKQGNQFLLRFVKRIGEGYPGNEAPGYEGTTLQEVMRALIDRARYVNQQIPCAETEAAIGLLEGALLLFEVRAKRVKGKMFDTPLLSDVIDGIICPTCGHVKCDEHKGSSQMESFPAEVTRDAEDPNAWRVEKLDSDGDAGVDVAIFAGPNAHERAVEYAIWKYGGVRR